MEEIALSLIKKLNSCGYEAYFVGGSVRDKISGRVVSDYDITTNATPAEIKRVFSDYEIFCTGEKHGTISVVVEKEVYEITTYRTDGDYSDHRHPESVKFVTSLKEDLARRDFTINALAYNEESGIIDLFGGVNDIEAKTIRAVGEPEKRFTEDALRILRAIRFSAQLGFKIDDETYRAMLKCKAYLKNVSVERIYTELTKTLCGKFAYQAIYDYHEIIFEVIPELKDSLGFEQYSLSHDYDVFNHTVSALKRVRRHTPLITWTVLLHDIGKPYCLVFDKKGYGHSPGHMDVSAKLAREILTRFKAPKDFIKSVETLILYHDVELARSKYEVKKFLSRYGRELCDDLLEVKFADIYAHSVFGIRRYLYQRTTLRDTLTEILVGGECYTLDTLSVDGNDLTTLGFKGKRIGEVLEILLDLVMKDELENDKSVLLSYAETIL